PVALTEGFQRALLGAAVFIVAAAVIALRATNTKGEVPADAEDAPPETDASQAATADATETNTAGANTDVIETA
ncbi:hypothetical protein AB0J52_21305, partial [Spirillospora sp. NPDC049652]